MSYLVPDIPQHLQDDLVECEEHFDDCCRKFKKNPNGLGTATDLAYAMRSLQSARTAIMQHKLSAINAELDEAMAGAGREERVA